MAVCAVARLFLSTPSARRATSTLRRMQGRRKISIHALREEGDDQILGDGIPRRHFYPRPPRGGRLFHLEVVEGLCRISIHALREEGDLQSGQHIKQTGDFYPRPPRGGRPEAL